MSLSLLDFTFLPLVNHCLDPSARLAHKGDIMLTSSFDSSSDAASHSPNSSNVVKSQNHSFDFLCSDRHGQLVVDRCGPLLNLFKLYQESTVTKILYSSTLWFSSALPLGVLVSGVDCNGHLTVTRFQENIARIVNALPCHCWAFINMDSIFSSPQTAI